MATVPTIPTAEEVGDAISVLQRLVLVAPPRPGVVVAEVTEVGKAGKSVAFGREQLKREGYQVTLSMLMREFDIETPFNNSQYRLTGRFIGRPSGDKQKYIRISTIDWGGLGWEEMIDSVERLTVVGKD